jgi:molecular chaperone GrpE
MDRGEALEALVDEQQARADADEYRELYVRTLADFDNYRKRIERERAEIGAAGKRDLLYGLLEIVDNFELALASAAGGASDDTAMAAGVVASYRQLRRLLDSNGVAAFASVGQPFDPELMEAVGLVPSDTVEPDHVVEEARPGYTLNGKLLRAAKVFVSKGPGPEARA